MVVMKVTPVKNVLISKRCYKSESTDLFFNKVVNDDTKVSVYDVSDRKQKVLAISDINIRNHRMVINDRKFFICSIRNGA
ncbi:MAG TPA: hypothetical protein VHT34_03050 [Clostridia bacterium]|nr:hypothetical protein [Clostridia bacterium]